MKKISAVILLLFIAIAISAQTEKKIIILHTNDVHSSLIGYAPESAYTPLTANDDNTVGGFARIASILKSEKEKNGGIILTVDAGDFLMGTLFQQLESETGFQLWLMKTMGYDIVCIGNHEFDYGCQKLANIISSAGKRDGLPPVLMSNAVFDENDPGDDALEELFAAGAMKRTFIMERGGLRIGLFSLMGVEADDNAAYAPPVTFSKQIPAARKYVKQLKDEKCDLIICLSHSGIAVDKKTGGWTGEDVGLAEKVKGINVIISGHSHTRLDNPVVVNGIPIVQAGVNGQWVGRLSLTYNNGIVKVDNYSLIPVNDMINGDPVVDRLIGDQKKIVTKEILEPLGMDYERKVAESGFLLECNEQGDIKGSNLGPLVADAIHSYVNKHDKSGTDVSMVAVGVIRDKIVPGFQTAADIFKVMSMGTGRDNVPGYPLSKLYVTGREFKNILEILQVIYQSTPGNYIYYSGIKVKYDPDKGLLKKIKKISIIRTDGTVKEVDFSKKNMELYSITASSYLLEYIGIIKKKSHGLINVVPKDASGIPIKDLKNAIIDLDAGRDGIQEGKEWLAIMEYLQSMKDTNGNGIPDIDNRYREAIQSFFTVE